MSSIQPDQLASLHADQRNLAGPLIDRSQIAAAEFVDAALIALKVAADIIRAHQMNGSPNLAAEIKDDETFVTQIDRKAGAAILSALKILLPSATFEIEDSNALQSNLSSRDLILIDPLDGTQAFANGLITSTIIIARVDRFTGLVTECVIGEPATGRTWLNKDGQTLYQQRCPDSFRVIAESQCKVWNGSLSPQATLLADVARGFTSRGKQILSDAQMQKVLGSLASSGRLLMAGSNGLHHALVSMGRDRMAGGITTAIGGAWDVCGASLILNAGGAAKAFSVERDGASNPILKECNPLAVLTYDILVYGNNDATVQSLTEMLHRAVISH